MELGVGAPEEEEEEEISMPMPIVSYAPPIIHEVSKLRLLAGAGTGEPAVAGAVTDTATTTVTISGEEDTRPSSVPPVAATSEQTTHADAAATATTKKKSVRYRECLKNHAANIGGHAIDGCGEFMPSGQEGTLEALKCAACNCHRNFHRREVQGADHICCFCNNNNNSVSSLSRKLSVFRHGVSATATVAAAAAASSSALISGGGGGFESGSSHEQQQQQYHEHEHEHDPHHGLYHHHHHLHHHRRHQMNIGFMGAAHPLAMLIPASQQYHPHHQHQKMQMQMQMQAPAMMVKKRFRTKFTQEQKDKMFAFAEKLGWRIQKHDEVAVQQICMELGIKRHVLKVWMHNNKHTLGKKI